MSDRTKLLVVLFVIVLAALLAVGAHVDANNWAWVTLGALALLFLEHPVTLAFGALQISAKAKLAETTTKAGAP